MSEFVADRPEPVRDMSTSDPIREMSTGVPPADLDDQDLSRQLGSLDRTAQDVREHGSPQAEQHHEARTRELEAEQERRVHGADPATGEHSGVPVTADDIRVLAQSTSQNPVLALVGDRLVVMDAADVEPGGRVVYSKEHLVADAGEDVTDIEAELLAGRLAAALADAR
jgi:hypothetical protein